MKKLLALALSLCLMLLITNCAGGGSEGTGGSVRTVQGVVATPEGAPVPNAEVTILSTGDSSLTDSTGSFTIQTEDLSSSLELEIAKDTAVAETTISQLDTDSNSVQVTIKFDESQSAATVSHLDVDVAIVGACDIYFENNRVIRQANAVPQGQRCTAKITTRSNGKLTGNVSYALRYGDCSGTGPMTILGTGLTSVAFNPGIAQITFPFYNDSAHCIYEFVIPYNSSGGQEPIIYRIETFTKQNQ